MLLTSSEQGTLSTLSLVPPLFYILHTSWNSNLAKSVLLQLRFKAGFLFKWSRWIALVELSSGRENPGSWDLAIVFSYSRGSDCVQQSAYICIPVPQEICFLFWSVETNFAAVKDKLAVCFSPGTKLSQRLNRSRTQILLRQRPDFYWTTSKCLMCQIHWSKHLIPI